MMTSPTYMKVLGVAANVWYPQRSIQKLMASKRILVTAEYGGSPVKVCNDNARCHLLPSFSHVASSASRLTSGENHFDDTEPYSAHYSPSTAWSVIAYPISLQHLARSPRHRVVACALQFYARRESAGR